MRGGVPTCPPGGCPARARPPGAPAAGGAVGVRATRVRCDDDALDVQWGGRWSVAA